MGADLPAVPRAGLSAVPTGALTCRLFPYRRVGSLVPTRAEFLLTLPLLTCCISDCYPLCYIPCYCLTLCVTACAAANVTA